MVDLLIQLLVRLYPRRWRARYGSELHATACEAYHRGNQTPFAIAADLLIGSLRQRATTPAHSSIALGAPAVVALAIAFAMQCTSTDPSTTADEQYQPTNESMAQTHPSYAGQTVDRSSNHLLKIKINPDNGSTVSMLGRPVHVLLNPDTGRISTVRSTASAR